MDRITKITSWLTLAAALLAAGYLTFADTYSGQVCSTTPEGTQGCRSYGETLAEANGEAVLFWLLVPLAFAVAMLLAVLFRAPRWVLWAVAVPYLLFCMFTGFSIGFLFLPSAFLALIAATGYAGRARVPGTPSGRDAPVRD